MVGCLASTEAVATMSSHIDPAAVVFAFASYDWLLVTWRREV